MDVTIPQRLSALSKSEVPSLKHGLIPAFQRATLPFSPS